MYMREEKRRQTTHTRMQVLPGAGDRKLEINEPSQAVGERARACLSHVRDTVVEFLVDRVRCFSALVLVY
jgi:hypothetical protein